MNTRVFKFILKNLQDIIRFPLEKNARLKQLHVHTDTFNTILIILDNMYNFSTEKSKILDLMIKFGEEGILFLSSEKCLRCKIRGLMTLHLITAFRLRMEGKEE